MESDNEDRDEFARLWVYSQYLRGYAGVDTMESGGDTRMTCEGFAAFVVGVEDRGTGASPKFAREVVALAKKMCEK